MTLSCLGARPSENTQGIVFSTMYILAYKPSSATNRDQNITFDHLFCVAKLVFSKAIIYICSNMSKILRHDL